MHTIEYRGYVVTFNPYSDHAYVLIDGESFNFASVKDAKDYLDWRSLASDTA